MGDVPLKRMEIRRITAMAAVFFAALQFSAALRAQAKPVWKSVEFAIVRINDEAPKSWNIYHTEKKGVLLVRLWKRYLLVKVQDEEVYEIDPRTVKPQGENVEWSLSDAPSDPLDTPDWKTRDVGAMEMVRFRLGKGGHFLELQIPILPNGKPMY